MNIYRVDKFIDEMIKENVKSFSFQLLSSNESNLEKNILSDEELILFKEKADKVKRIASQKGVKTIFFPIDVIEGNMEQIYTWYNTLDFLPWNGCTYIEGRLRVSPYGDVFSCIEKPFVNLKDVSLHDALDNKDYIQFKEKIRNKGPISECVRCCNYYHR